MRKLFLLFIGIILLSQTARATNSVFVSQAGAGSVNGTNCANAEPVTYFNNGANWSATPSGIQIGPDTTVSLCGTINSNLNPPASGSAGHPVIMICAAGGCDLSEAANGLIYLGSGGGVSHFIIDGNFPCGPGVVEATCTGIIENTANGTGLANQTAVQAIFGTGAGDIVIRNWLFRNIYVHNSLTDTTIDDTLCNIFYANGLTGNFTFNNNTVHDVGWALNFLAYSNTPTIDIHDNYFYNYGHGLGVGAPDSTNYALVKFHDNHVGFTTSWDTNADTYHQDGTHFYATTTYNASWSFYVYNNLFDGSMGIDNTANVFCEENPPNTYIFNNVHVQASGNLLNNGMVNCGGTVAAYNNTDLGSSVNSSLCTEAGQTGFLWKNNVASGCNTFIKCFNTCTALTNIYAAVAAGGNAPYIYNGTNETTFANWQAAAGDAAPSAQVSSAGLNSTGVPLAGSAVIGIGTNLTSLCSGNLVALCNDTSAGGTRTPVARPASGAWDIGAYQFAGGVTSVGVPLGRLP